MKKYEAIVSDLSSKISSRMLSPGDALPSETKIIAQYNVSRITAQKALNTMVEMNLATRIRGSGTYVNSELPKNNLMKNKFVSMIIPNTISGSLHILEGASEVFSKSEIHMSVLVSGDTPSLELDTIKKVLNTNTSGILLYLNSYEPTPLLETLISNNYPIVFIDKSFVNIPCTSVSTDGFSGSRKITEMIINKGHKKIGFIGQGVGQIETVNQRYSGFRSILNKHNIDINKNWILSNDDLASSIEKLLLSKEQPTAYFCCNDNTVALLVRIASKLGIQIPDDISIASFDGKEITSNMSFELTTAHQPYSMIGRTAAELLLDKLIRHDHVHKKVYLPVEIIEGNSIAQISNDIKSFSAII